MRFSGAKLKAIREARKMGQHELANAARSYGAGVQQGGVSKHENGKQPTMRNAIAYARALGVDLSELCDMDEPLSRDDSDDDEEEDDPVVDLTKAIRRLVDAQVAKAVKA